MKKTIIMVFIALIISAMIYPAGINVTSPRANSTWNTGEKLVITWTTRKYSSSQVKINIFKNAITQANFIKQLTGKNNGKLVWNIPAGFSQGAHFIRIKCIQDKTLGDSGLFHIKSKTQNPPPGNAPSLSVKYPNGGELLSKNSQTTIRWNSSGMSGNINIELWKGNRKYGTIAGSVPVSRGNISWKVGDTFGNVPAGAANDYRIKLSGNGKEDLSDRFFKISDLPAIIQNNNNIINNIHTFQNPPSQTYQLAIPPEILEIKVWSKDPKFRGQVRFGESFDVKILFKNTSGKIDKTDWDVTALLNNQHKQTQRMWNSRSPRNPGQTWWFEMKNLISSYLKNKSAFHVLKIEVGGNKKTTMMGIIETKIPVYPNIKRFAIYDPVSGSYKEKGKYKKGDHVELAYNVLNATQLTFRNMSSNKVVKTISLPQNSGEGYTGFNCEVSGYIKMTATSNTGNYKEANVYLDSTGPLQIGGDYLDFDMWRVKRNIKTRGMVQNYRSVTLVEILNNGAEKVLKKITTNTPKSARLDWEIGPVAFPIKLRLRVVFLNYSQQSKEKTFN